MRINRILVVEAHPDDGAVFAGGTIAKLVDQGHDVYYLTLTDGQKGTWDRSYTQDTLAETMRKEANNAASILGIKDVAFLGYRDLELPYSLEVIGKIIRRIRNKTKHRHVF